MRDIHITVLAEVGEQMQKKVIFYEDRFESKSETVTEIFKKENIWKR